MNKHDRTPLILTLFIVHGCHGGGASQLRPPDEPTPSSAHPADHLPSHIRRLTLFGERPDWSPDGKRVLFLSKVFGDAFEYELATGRLLPVTMHFRHHGFTRALYLPDGGILLSGPREDFDETDRASREQARSSCWLSLLGKQRTAAPVPLDAKVSEGPAVSRRRPLIAWAETWRQHPERLAEHQSQIFVAELGESDGKPALVNRRLVLDSQRMPFEMHSIETQNFIPPADDKLTLAVYGHGGTETFVLDLTSGAYENMSKAPDAYDEPEGIFPDGKSTTVESAPNNGSAWPLIDVYRLWLDGSGRKQRLTHFTRFKNYKASQPVVRDDGRRLVFQLGRSGDEAGEGHGVFLLDLDALAQ